MVMQKKSFFKDLLRSIYKSKARFLSILAIIAIGVGFYAGINATEPDMILSADKYYREKNLSDFRIISPLGFTSEDIEEVRAIQGVDRVQEGYTKDLFLTSSQGDTSTIKLFSYDEKDYKNSSGINIPIIKEGRMPEKSGEIVVEYGTNVPEDIKLGNQVTLSLPNGEKHDDFLKSKSYTIVGIIDSPLYINFERGQTNIGDGSIDFFAYIHRDDFSMERVNELFITSQDSKNFRAYSQEYKEHLVTIEKSISSLGIEAMARETKEIRDELNEGKEELNVEKSKAERELADAEKDLLNAQREISKGERELEKNAIKYTQELEDKKAELEKGKEKLEEGKVLYQENYKIWLEGFNECNIGMAELKSAKNQLDKGKIELQKAEEKLADVKTKLDEAKTQLSILKQTIDQLKNLRQELLNNPPTTQEGFNRLIDDISFLPLDIAETLKQSYDNTSGNIEYVIIILDGSISRLEEEYILGEKDYQQGVAMYEAGLKELNKNKNLYEGSLKEYEAGLKEINAAKVSIDRGKIELDKAKATIEENERKLIEGEEALIQGEKDLESSLDEGRRELAKAKVELSEGWDTFEEEKADALKKIQEAQEEIKDAEREILEIPEEWFVLDREGNPGYAGYGDDAQRIGAVAKVFPLFFFLVAALVCLTTMTRMIEEERGQIGTLKALGYNTLTISSKYIIYALLSSLIGALVGLSIGFKLFPIAIMNAYGIMYKIPERIAIYHYNYAIISILLAVITTVSAALLATLQELRSTPATLLQPKAPRPGKRIFMERISPLWKRLSFSHKVTARNIFRYKRRFLMTIIGIAGCTALLIAGFGIRDSIDIMDIQFGDIFTYDGQVILDTDKDEDKRDLEEILGGQHEVKSYIRTLNQSVNALVKGSGRTYDVNLLVPEDVENFKEFFNLHERESKAEIDLSSNGAVITEKLAELLNVGLGDTFKYRDSDNINYEIRVDGIAENYLSHYIYMSPEYFENITLKEPEYNSGIFNIKDIEKVDEGEFKESLIEHEGVLGVVLTEKIANETLITMESLDFVILIIIISAGALAFLVLYNLTNINITERIREIATIKVLGFRDKEVSSYVYRENVILTIIGIFVGLFLGIAFHRYIIITMEIDTMMFGKEIDLLSFIIAIILTMTFSLLVNFFMHFKLRSVNMVESLKSIE